jgi:hypothetical protein
VGNPKTAFEQSEDAALLRTQQPSMKEDAMSTETTGSSWGDRSDEWSKRIAAAHPMETGDHVTYIKAMEMVGNRHSKGALVELVNWLLKGQP